MNSLHQRVNKIKSINLMKHLKLLCLVAVAALATTVALDDSMGWHPEDVPSPQMSGDDNWVSDPDGYLSSSQISRINAHLNYHSHLKKPRHWITCGAEMKPYQIAFGIIDRMEPRFGPIDTFAKRMMNRWGVGYRECNNGVTLLLSIEDREIAIVKGAGVATASLTPEFRHHVIQKMKPFLREFMIGDGLEVAAESLANRLAEESYRYRPTNSSWDEWDATIWTMLTVTIPMILLVSWGLILFILFVSAMSWSTQTKVYYGPWYSPYCWYSRWSHWRHPMVDPPLYYHRPTYTPQTSRTPTYLPPTARDLRPAGGRAGGSFPRTNSESELRHRRPRTPSPITRSQTPEPRQTKHSTSDTFEVRGDPPKLSENHRSRSPSPKTSSPSRRTSSPSRRTSSPSRRPVTRSTTRAKTPTKPDQMGGGKAGNSVSDKW